MTNSVDAEIRHHRLLAESDDFGTVEVIHGHLDVVDTKTSVLLTFNGLLITVYAVLVGLTDLSLVLPHFGYWSLPLMGSAVLIVASTVLCLYGLDIIGAHNRKDVDVEMYLKHAAQVSIARTNRYLWALRCTGLGCIVVLLAFLFSVWAVV